MTILIFDRKKVKMLSRDTIENYDKNLKNSYNTIA